MRGAQGLETRPQTMRSFKSQPQPLGSRLQPSLRICSLRVEPEASPHSGRSPQRAGESCQSRKHFFILDHGWFLKGLGFHTIANKVGGAPSLGDTIPSSSHCTSQACCPAHCSRCKPSSAEPSHTSSSASPSPPHLQALALRLTCLPERGQPAEDTALTRFLCTWNMIRNYLWRTPTFMNKPCPPLCDANAILPLQPVYSACRAARFILPKAYRVCPSLFIMP